MSTKLINVLAWTTLFFKKLQISKYIHIIYIYIYIHTYTNIYNIYTRPSKFIYIFSSEMLTSHLGELTPYSWFCRYGSWAASQASATAASRANWYTSRTVDNNPTYQLYTLVKNTVQNCKAGDQMSETT